MTDVLVIGGGAAGMMAALATADQGAQVCLLERNPKVGRKLYITGKGRCNVTNHCGVEQVLASTPRNSRFLYGAMTRTPPQWVENFFEELGVPLKVERGNRVFPSLTALRISLTHYSALSSAARCPSSRTGSWSCVLKRTAPSLRWEREANIPPGRWCWPPEGRPTPQPAPPETATLWLRPGHTIVPAKPSLVPFGGGGVFLCPDAGPGPEKCGAEGQKQKEKSDLPGAGGTAVHPLRHVRSPGAQRPAPTCGTLRRTSTPASLTSSPLWMRRSWTSVFCGSWVRTPTGTCTICWVLWRPGCWCLCCWN